MCVCVCVCVCVRARASVRASVRVRACVCMSSTTRHMHHWCTCTCLNVSVMFFQTLTWSRGGDSAAPSGEMSNDDSGQGTYESSRPSSLLAARETGTHIRGMGKGRACE